MDFEVGEWQPLENNSEDVKDCVDCGVVVTVVANGRNEVDDPDRVSKRN